MALDHDAIFGVQDDVDGVIDRRLLAGVDACQHDFFAHLDLKIQNFTQEKQWTRL